MVIATLRQQLGLEITQKPLRPVILPEHLDAFKTASAALAQSIEDETVTVAQIDIFLQETFHLLPDSKQQQGQDVLEFLLCTKAVLLFGQGKENEGLELYDEALGIIEKPSTWALKGTALLQQERIDESFHAFQKAYALKDAFGPQKKEYLQDLFAVWSGASLLQALSGILNSDLRESAKGAHQYLQVVDNAREENLDSAVLTLTGQEPVSQELQDALEELALMVRLLGIKDPFDRWREFTKEISKVWPKGVSAVDAIREQRDREW